MKSHLILLLAAFAGIATAENVAHNMVSRRTMVNTNLIGAAIGEGLSLSNGVLSATGGGSGEGLTTNDVRAIVEDSGFLPSNSVHGASIGWAESDDKGRRLRMDGSGFETDWLGVFGSAGETMLLANPEADEAPVVKLPASSGTLAREEDLAPYAQTASLGTAAYRNASEFATAADEAIVYQLLMGSNVVAEVTNYNSRVRAPQLRLLQLDPDTHEYITVWAETNGLTRTLNDANAFTAATSNALDMAKADRAWSRHTSGLGADAPSGVTWISTPETVIAGGYEYERHVTSHGEVWVLTSNGMGFGGDSNAYFRVSTPDGETLFSIEKTDEQIVGVLTDGINVSGGVVTLDVGVTTYNGQAPICMAAQSVSGPWSDLSEGRPAWISSVATNGVNGAWSFELESTASAAFFYFLVRQPGATVIKNSAQTDLSGGILVEGTRFFPHKSGSTLTWTTTP